ncbi:Pre-mRNA splicing factor-domain-containing protein [Cercophora newfieldiana]|uniref:Pre-mRNA splicing factor-domain-containing protein n=1 Tax=Cercophora newfieldiana TaxID=92897 RepID=A0AA40CYN0_9PEZI|nr:Pre-mRNA splicing factor-domain-containing protein [Cercophora newfieldiana]
MGAGDLNMKKSWHPQRSGNVAATQKAEAEAIAERKKLQLRLQEIEEERRKEEIQKTLEAAGGKRRIDRVEWMYAGPTDGQVGDAAESEAYLLGKRRIDKLLQDNEVKKLSKQPSQDTLAALPAISNARDVASKVREDPLLAIKRQEQQAYEAMMNDPIKRRQLLASMGIEDPHQKPSRQEEKRGKHRHQHRSHRSRGEDRDDRGHRSSHRRRSDSRDRSRSPRDSQSPRRRKHNSSRRQRSRSPRGYDDDTDGRSRRRRDSPDTRRHRSRSMDSPDRDHERGKRRDGQGDRRSSRRDNAERYESRSPSPAPRRRDRSQDRDRPESRAYEGRGGDREQGPYRPRRDYSEDSKPRQTGRPPVDAGPSQEQLEQERARKLAAMQDAATDLDKDRERRLAAIEEAERAQREADDRVRQRNKKLGGDAGFTSSLHSRAADMRVAERMRAR